MPLSTNLVLRTVYLDEAIDDAIASQAQSSGMSKADVFRQWLSRGLRVARKGAQSCEALPESSAPRILHTVHVDAAQDDLLRVEAFDRHVPRNQVLLEYLRLGRDVS